MPTYFMQSGSMARAIGRAPDPVPNGWTADGWAMRECSDYSERADGEWRLYRAEPSDPTGNSDVLLGTFRAGIGQCTPAGEAAFLEEQRVRDIAAAERARERQFMEQAERQTLAEQRIAGILAHAEDYCVAQDIPLDVVNWDVRAELEGGDVELAVTLSDDRVLMYETERGTVKLLRVIP